MPTGNLRCVTTDSWAPRPDKNAEFQYVLQISPGFLINLMPFCPHYVPLVLKEYFGACKILWGCLEWTFDIDEFVRMPLSAPLVG
jgi:hypothetical protein